MTNLISEKDACLIRIAYPHATPYVLRAADPIEPETLRSRPLV